MSAAFIGRRITGLTRAVLPAIDNGYFDEIAQGVAVIDPHHRAVWPRDDRAHRHVFVKGLIGRGAPAQKLLWIVERLRPFVGVIILHFVIVPGDDRWNLRMQALQVRVEPVLRIAIAVGRQRRRFDAVAVAADDRSELLDGLVDIVAEKQDECRIFSGQVAVRGKIAVLVIGAGDKTEAQRRGRRTRRRQRRRMSGRTHRIAREEAVPIGSPGFEAGDIEMHRIGEGLFGTRATAAHDFGHARIARDLIAQGHVSAAHAARRFRIARQRLGREPGPQHKAIGARRAGRNAEAERIAGPPALRGGGADKAWRSNRRCNRRKSSAGATDEATTAKMPGSEPTLHSPLTARLRLCNIFAGFYDILTPAKASEQTNHG